MADLPELLLAHLQREAREARELTSISEYEKQTPSSYKELDEGHTLLRCLEKLNYEI
jgi:hypothetical protein